MDGKTLSFKRVTIFAGHYGSGKTNIAVNSALSIGKSGNRCAIADLDIVNPYFRTKDAARVLEEHGVRMISSPYANTNVDTPALPAELYAVVDDKDEYAVLDVGGDDRGALALGRYREAILKENNYEMLFVINKYRYLTASARDTVEVMREIEEAAGMRFTAVVNNSNLGDETTADTVLNSVEYANEVAELSAIKIKMTAAKRELYDALKDKIENVFPIDIHVRQSW